MKLEAQFEKIIVSLRGIKKKTSFDNWNWAADELVDFYILQEQVYATANWMPYTYSTKYVKSVWNDTVDLRKQ